MSYPVNAEGWKQKNTLFRNRRPKDNYSIEHLVESAGMREGVNEHWITEQRYPTQVIELLQRGEGWNIWSGDGPVNPLWVVEVCDKELGVLPIGTGSSTIWSDVIAYRLITNDHYINGERVVLREGDWVRTVGLSDNDCKSIDIAIDNCGVVLNSCIGKRELTPAQFLNAENAKDTTVSEQCEDLIENDSPDDLDEQPSKYHRLIKGQWIDVYDILNAFDPDSRNAADDHAIKKMLLPGKRGVKDGTKDRREAIQSLVRSLEIL